LLNDNFIKDEGLTRAWSGKKFHFLQIQKTSGLFLQEFLERYFLKGIEYVISIDPPFKGLACPIQNVKTLTDQELMKLTETLETYNHSSLP